MQGMAGRGYTRPRHENGWAFDVPLRLAYSAVQRRRGPKQRGRSSGSALGFGVNNTYMYL